jgi:hypothetical protein
MKLENVFVEGKTYLVALVHDDFGSIAKKVKFEGYRDLGNLSYYRFSRGVRINEAPIKSFYAIGEENLSELDRKRKSKYISIDLKNGICLTVTELKERVEDQAANFED